MILQIDSHLYYALKNNLNEVLERANELGVNRFICVATNLNDARESLQLSKKYPNIFASAGIHPHDAKDAPSNFTKTIYELMKHDSMVAVGEIGLDYFRNISDKKVQAAIEWLSQSESNNVDVLRDWFLVSSLQIGGEPWAEVLVSEDNDLASVEIAKARGFKCERCWHYEIEMSKNQQHPNICKRCEKVVLAI